MRKLGKYLLTLTGLCLLSVGISACDDEPVTSPNDQNNNDQNNNDQNNNDQNNNAKCEVTSPMVCDGDKITFCHPATQLKTQGNCPGCVVEKNFAKCSDYNVFFQPLEAKAYDVSGYADHLINVVFPHIKSKQNTATFIEEANKLFDGLFDYDDILNELIMQKTMHYWGEKEIENAKLSLKDLLRSYGAGFLYEILQSGGSLELLSSTASLDKTSLTGGFAWQSEEKSKEVADFRMELGPNRWVLKDIFYDDMSLVQKGKHLFNAISRMPIMESYLYYREIDYLPKFGKSLVSYVFMITLGIQAKVTSAIIFAGPEAKEDDIIKAQIYEAKGKGLLKILPDDASEKDLEPKFDAEKKIISYCIPKDYTVINFCIEFKADACAEIEGRIDCDGETLLHTGDEAKCDPGTQIPEIIDNDKVKYCSTVEKDTYRFRIFDCPDAKIDEIDEKGKKKFKITCNNIFLGMIPDERK